LNLKRTANDEAELRGFANLAGSEMLNDAWQHETGRQGFERADAVSGFGWLV
jgi:hypothetical protein